MISNFRACLTLALRNTQDAKLIFWQRENPQELRDYITISDGTRQKKLSIVPDGYFCIEDKGGKMYFFLEADRSTMTNARFLSKMRAYWLMWNRTRKGGANSFGIESFRVLTVAKTSQRKANLRKAAKQADSRNEGSLLFWFISEDAYQLKSPMAILESIWQTPKDDNYHCLLE